VATTDSIDGQVYLVKSKQGAVCIDTGAGRWVDTILTAARQNETDPSTNAGLDVTHAHADHAGGTAAGQERRPGIKVAMAAESAGVDEINPVPSDLGELVGSRSPMRHRHVGSGS
jgi:glyoxylase-like metal-dependent hydrolase (beta-lactamase superfamily II)